MAWSGGVFSRLRNWVNDAAAGINIEANNHDSEDDNFATGINACINKDGSNSNVKSTSTEVVINEDGGDVDFRVEADTQTHSLYVNGQNSTTFINSTETIDTTLFATLTASDADLVIDGAKSNTGTVVVRSSPGAADTHHDYIGITTDPGVAGAKDHYQLSSWAYDTGGNSVMFTRMELGATGVTTGTFNGTFVISCAEDGVSLNGGSPALSIEGTSVRAGVSDFGTSNSATRGFFYIPVMDGAPTGNPISHVSRRSGAMVFDDTNDTLYIYNGSAWVSVALT